MRRVGRKGREGPTRAGSVLGDVAAIAAKIYAGLIDGDVAVWADPMGDIHFMAGSEPPANKSGEVLGIYRMGASTKDIEDDLIELRRSRASDAIIF